MGCNGVVFYVKKKPNCVAASTLERSCIERRGNSEMSCPALRFSPWSLSDYPVYVLPRTMETPKWKPSLVFYLHAQIYRNPPPPTATTTTTKPYSLMVIKLHPSHLLYIEGSGKGNGNGTIRPCRANHSMNKQLVFGPPNSVRLHLSMCV